MPIDKRLGAQRGDLIPYNPTVEQVMKWATIKDISIAMSSEKALEEGPKGPFIKPKVTRIAVKSESDMKPDMFIDRRESQEVNIYVGCDGFKYYFDRKDGKALGGELKVPSKEIVPSLDLSRTPKVVKGLDPDKLKPNLEPPVAAPPATQGKTTQGKRA